MFCMPQFKNICYYNKQGSKSSFLINYCIDLAFINYHCIDLAFINCHCIDKVFIDVYTDENANF